MKELLILSGKGGTGKTTISSAFIWIGEIGAYADCDVDAPNLHLVMGEFDKGETSNYYGMDKAYIDQETCNNCDLCKQYCKFDAINVDSENNYSVNNYACEGCSVCEWVCPVDAISMKRYKSGELRLHKEPDIFSTAQLKMGSGNSGLLVTDVKKALRTASEGIDLAIIDGSPGIGCPVIASIAGVDMVLIVAEPSISGMQDMERIIETSKRFRVKLAVCVNKFDTNLKITEKIEKYCKNNRIDFLGIIPFDKAAVSLVNEGLSIVDKECKAGEATKEIFERTIDILEN